MAEQPKTRRHAYGVAGLLRLLPGIFAVLILLTFFLKMARQVQDIQSLAGFLWAAGLVGILVLCLAVVSVVMTIFPAVEVTQAGMKIQFFWFWWIFVPWGQVAAVYYWPRGFKWVVVVETKGLTRFHLVYGLIYAHKTVPTFLIGTTISGYADLMGVIGAETGTWTSSPVLLPFTSLLFLPAVLIRKSSLVPLERNPGLRRGLWTPPTPIAAW